MVIWLQPCIQYMIWFLYSGSVHAQAGDYRELYEAVPDADSGGGRPH